ncbi:hypothetical protein D3C87_1520330 [compost metagenome]
MLLQLLLHLALQFVRSGQHALHRPELLQQLQRCFLTNARHSGNIVAGIAHQTFQVNDLLRCQIILLADLPGPVHFDFGNPFADQSHRCML